MLRDSYKHLLGLPYKSGSQDCYGLAVRYFKELYNLDLLNFARPDGWWNDPDIDLINDCLQADGWENIGINIKGLKLGDALVFSLINGRANHVGIYVGNGMFIHHVYQRFSCEEALMDKWTSRLLMIVRHPEISKANHLNKPKTDAMSILPEHIRARIIRTSQP
jgi:cell wall-associated NlpC family hydrolase